MLKYTRYAVSGLALMCLLGCTQSDYTKMVKTELGKGIRQDSLLFGIRFGDTRNDFYGKCFDLNKRHLVAQGPGNASVQYIFVDSLVHDKPTEMRLLFYPRFDKNERIAEMKMEFSYTGWAPWNKALQSDSLKVKIIDLLMLWYKGNDFVTASINDSTSIPVKLDGNRRLLIQTNDTRSVKVNAQDILHPVFQHATEVDDSED